MYGGEAKTSLNQENDTWNNNLLALDLTSTWDTSSPSLTGLPQPSGPPAVALGALWNDYTSLYVYGGEFADNPFQEPAEVSTWQYKISSGKWTEYSDPQTSSGNNSASEGVPVQRAAEGAAVSVPELGLSWYFGGHLDLSTTPGWSIHTERVYIKSLLEFTHPGYSNDGVFSLRGSGAPASGTYRNITEGGLQLSDTFTERADGVLVFVPGWGTSGVLIGLGGGTAEDFVDDMSTLDVYDIANSVWYHQQTTGSPPGVRVNPCAVVASAPDASSFQIYVFGGQNLQPAVGPPSMICTPVQGDFHTNRHLCAGQSNTIRRYVHIEHPSVHLDWACLPRRPQLQHPLRTSWTYLHPPRWPDGRGRGVQHDCLDL